MKAYYSIFRIRMQEALQYRAAAWAGVTTQFFWGFMLIMIYQAFYESSDRVMPMTFEQLCSYIWMQQAFLILVETWSGRDSELFEKITSGSVAYELCRPLELYQHWFARLLAGRLGGAIEGVKIAIAQSFYSGTETGHYRIGCKAVCCQWHKLAAHVIHL